MLLADSGPARTLIMIAFLFSLPAVHFCARNLSCANGPFAHISVKSKPLVQWTISLLHAMTIPLSHVLFPQAWSFDSALWVSWRSRP